MPLDTDGDGSDVNRDLVDGATVKLGPPGSGDALVSLVGRVKIIVKFLVIASIKLGL